MRPGRTFLRRLIDLTCRVNKPHHRITLNKESRRDISAWKLFIEKFNGKHLLLGKRWETDRSLHLFTDAAGSLGFAGIFGSQWFYDSWPPELAQLGITFKELFPIVLAFEVWGEHMKDKCIILHSDNLAVVHVLNKQSSKDPIVMKLLRRLVLQAMHFNILFKAEHIPGKSNVLPDLLSRLQVAKFKDLAPHMNVSQTPISRHLLDMG